jgi:hypothetical protein
MYIVCKGVAGLGNRLCSLSCAIEYSVETGRRLVVEWNDRHYSSTPAHNAFHDCFRLVGVESGPERSCEIPDLESLSIAPAMWRGQLAAASNRVVRFGGPGAGPVWGLSDSYEGQPASIRLDGDHQEDVVVFLAYAPPLAQRALLDHVRLQPSIDRLVEKFAKENFTGPVIGVHVRSTDRKPSQSIDVLHAKIRNARGVLGDSRLFLSTDNRDVIGEFRRRYDDVVVMDKWLPETASASGIHHGRGREFRTREVERAHREAVVEMFLLSRCDWLIYQRNSTFSQIAACHSRAGHVEHW